MLTNQQEVVTTDNTQQVSRDGSQTNREKLYKRFKKLNAQGEPQIAQIHSQKNLGYAKGKQPVEQHQAAMKNRSSQPSRTDKNSNNLTSNTAYVSPTNSMNERLQRAGNMPCQSPNNTAQLLQGRVTSQSASQNTTNKMVDSQQLPYAQQYSAAQAPSKQVNCFTSSTNAQQPDHYPANGYSLSQLKEQLYKRPNSHGRNYGRAACSTSSAQKVFLGSNQDSYISNLPIDGGTFQDQTMTASSQNGGQLRSKDIQQMSTRTLQNQNDSHNDWRNRPHSNEQQQYTINQYNGSRQGPTQPYLSQSSEQDSNCYPGVGKQQFRQGGGAVMQKSGQSNGGQLGSMGVSQTHSQKVNLLQQQYVQQQHGQNQQQYQNKQTISMQSDMDLNPLNDSHMFHHSNQMRRGPKNQGNHLLNQSSFTNNCEAVSYSKFNNDNHNHQDEHQMTQSNSSLWLNEELDAAQYENRVRQSNFMQQNTHQMQLQKQQKNQQRQSSNLNIIGTGNSNVSIGQKNQRTSQSPDTMNISQLHQQWLLAQKGLGGSIDLHTQDSELPHNQIQHKQQQLPSYDPSEHSQHHLNQQQQQQRSKQQYHQMLNLKHLNGKTSNYNDVQSNISGMTAAHNQRQQSAYAGANYSNHNQALMLQNMNHQQQMSQNINNQQPASLTGRLSHQPNYPSHVSDAHSSMRASYQGPLPSHQFKNQFHFGVLNDENENKRTERSQQVSVAQFGDYSQLQGVKQSDRASLSKDRARSSDRNYALMQTHHLGQGLMNAQQQSVDPDQSYQQFERAKCSTRTNPYKNLLNSNYVGSTAPSATMIDQMTASQVNSCSQFAPGAMTIGAMTATMPSYAGGRHNNTMGTGMAHTLQHQHCSTEDNNHQYRVNNDFESQGHQNMMLNHNPSQNSLTTDRGQIRSGSRGKPMSQAEIQAAATHAQQAYTNQVAQSLLAQVRPGILKLIQSRIETIVQDLCDEGFYDQRTIMKVLEHRASQLFPDNFMVNALDTSLSQKDGNNIPNNSDNNIFNNLTGQLPASTIDEPDRPLSQAQIMNPALFTSHANFSNNEIPLDRSIYSDTMLTHTMDRAGIDHLQGNMMMGMMGSSQKQNNTINMLRTLKEEKSMEGSQNFRSDQLSAQMSSGNHQRNINNASAANHLHAKNQLAQFSNLTGTTQFNATNGGQNNGLNTTEKIIQSMTRHDSTTRNNQPLSNSHNEQEEEDVEAEIVEGEDGVDGNYIQDNQQESIEQAYAPNANEEGRQQNMNTDRLVDDIQSTSAGREHQRGRNFGSRKLQKSDDFKITFAYQSKKTSMDIDQTGSSLGGHRLQNSSGLNQQNNNNIQLQEENMVSFNPKDQLQVQSPTLSNEQIIDNIQTFTQQKLQLSTQRTPTNDQVSVQMMLQAGHSPSNGLSQGLFTQKITLTDEEKNRMTQQLIMENLANNNRPQQPLSQHYQKDMHDDTLSIQDQSTMHLTQSELAKLYFQSTSKNGGREEFQTQARHEAIAAANLLAAQQLIQNSQQNNNGAQQQEQQNSRNIIQPLDHNNFQQTQQYYMNNGMSRQAISAGTSLFQQKTVGSDLESERNMAYQRMHITQNSDLIDQIGQQFNIVNGNGHEQMRQNNNGRMTQQQYQTQQQNYHDHQMQMQQMNPTNQRNQTQQSGHQIESRFNSQPSNNAFAQLNTQQVATQDNKMGFHSFNEPVNTTVNGLDFNNMSGHQYQTQTPSQIIPSQSLSQIMLSQPTCVTQVVEQIEEPFRAGQLTTAFDSQSRPSSISNTEIIQNKTNLGCNVSSFYDVHAQGSIINIKRNQAGDPEMLILSSQKELKDVMNTQASNITKQKNNKKRKLSTGTAKQTSKSVSQRRSRKTSASKASKNKQAQRLPKRNNLKDGPRSASNINREGFATNPNNGSCKLGIRQGNLMTLKSSMQQNAKKSRSRTPRNHRAIQLKTPPKIQKNRSECRRLTQADNNYRISPVSMRAHKMRETEKHKRRMMTETKSLTSRSAKGGTMKLEKDLLQSLKGMRRETIEAKRDLKALYDHKIDRLRDDLHEQKRQSLIVFKEQLKFQSHATQVHKKRANNYKATADELATIAEGQRKTNQELIEQMQQNHRRRSSSTGLYSRSISNKRTQSNFFGSQVTSADYHSKKWQPQLGDSFKPGFSFVSKSLPRNNHNFVSRNISNISKMLPKYQQPEESKQITIGTSRLLQNNSLQNQTNQNNHRARPIINSMYESALVTENSFQKPPHAQHQYGYSQSIAMGNDTAELQKEFLASIRSSQQHHFEQKKDHKLMSQDLSMHLPETQKTQNHHHDNNSYLTEHDVVADVSVSFKHQQRSDNKHHTLLGDANPHGTFNRLVANSESEEFQNTAEEGVDMVNPLNSRTTFGVDYNHTTTDTNENSARSYDDNRIQQNYKSLFDASKTLISVKSKETTLDRSTPLRRGQANKEMKQKFVEELQQSGARFKCKNCKKGGRISVELPCATCLSQNCHADQTDSKDKKQYGKHMRKNGSVTTDISWNSSDLNTEYQDTDRRKISKKDRHAISSKLMKCSSDLIANQARLDQIQKILFQPRQKQPRQGGSKPERQSNHRQQKPSAHQSMMAEQSRTSTGDESFSTTDQNRSATLPQMIDRLRKSRQNLKF